MVKVIPVYGTKKPPPIRIGQFGLVRYGSNGPYNDWPYAPQFMEWFNCRDSFHYSWDRCKKKHFFYACDQHKVEAMIRTAETRIPLKWPWKTRIVPTDVKRVVWIKPARFWRVHPMRLSLFTILLRTALQYKDDFDAAIVADPLGEQTKDAIDYFLAGNVRYVGNEEGWYQQFDTRMLEYHRQTIDKLLVQTNFLWETKLSIFG